MVTKATATFKKLIAMSRNSTFINEKLAAIAIVGNRMQYNLPSIPSQPAAAAEQDSTTNNNAVNFNYKDLPADAVDVCLSNLFMP